MTTLTIKQLANGQVSSATSSMYTVAASTTAIVKTITLVNTNTITESVELYVLKASGTARRIIPQATQLQPGYQLEIDSPITLGAADAIQGSTTTGAKVDFVISGVEEA